jgi:hypothetical protein
VTLAVHPLCGQVLHVRSKYGSNALGVELSSGEERLIPNQWTDLHPRGDPLKIHEQAVLLDPDALRELSVWVATRRASLAERLCVADNEQHGKTQARPGGGSAPMVEQARSSSADGRSQRRKGAKR